MRIVKMALRNREVEMIDAALRLRKEAAIDADEIIEAHKWAAILIKWNLALHRIEGY